MPCPLTAGISAARQAGPLTTARILRARRVLDRAPVELGLSGLVPPPERVVEPRQLDRACLVAGVEAEGEVEAERAADLVPEEASERTAVHPPHELADEVPVEQGRLAVRRSGRPCRLLAGEQRAQLLPVVEDLGRCRLVERDDPGLMREHMPNGRRCAEVGPVALHRRIEVESTSVDEQQRADRRERLADRVRHDDAVLPPRLRTGCVGPAAPEVDDPVTVVPRCDRGSRSGLLIHQIGESLANRREPGVDRSVHHDQPGTTSFPPQASGSTSASVSENVH